MWARSLGRFAEIAAFATLPVVMVTACGRSTSMPATARTAPDPRAAASSAAPEAVPPRPAAPDPDALPPAEGLPPERRAIQVVAGEERIVDADAARARGLTLVDLRDDWAPAIFDDGVGPGGAVLPNRYRAIFVGLAADHTDGDGQPLAPGEKNYLELYGIPPALSVLRARFLTDASRVCDPTFDVTKLLSVDEITTWGATTEQKELARHRARAERLEAARQKAGVETLDELAQAVPRLARDVKAHQAMEAQRASFAEVEKRLACEGLYSPSKHAAGLYDTALRSATFDFQQKHAVMDQTDLKRGTLEALARPMLENDFRALRRVLTERAMHAGHFIEDGSSTASYAGADGKRHPVPDLAAAATTALLARLGIATPADALAFFRRHPARDFRWLEVAVRFPAPPEYYGPEMDVQAEIDRGDVWYDFPFDAAGARLPQPRERFPTFSFYVKWRGERVLLARWRTTIGGWRAELAADGQEYFRYKGSDVGPRVWRNIVAAPVWIPPPSSPLGSMVKEKRVNGAFVKVTNYDEVGPGYLSAYGLAAAIHVEMHKGASGVTYFDNGIRTHGSFDYTSLRGRFSHGCHRLYNNLAVRLFTFVLQHHRARALGPIELGFKRTFWSQGEVFEMRLPSRGFYYELDPPVPIEVLEGRVKGARQKPIAGYVRKPGAHYASTRAPAPSTAPESRAGGDE